MLEKHKLAPQILGVINNLLRAQGLALRSDTVVNVTLIAAPSFTKNATEAHVGVDVRRCQGQPTGQAARSVERVKVRIRYKVEHPFRVIKRQLGLVKVRYRGLAKNTAPLHAS